MLQARYFEKSADAESRLVICHLCPHNCRLKPQQFGICRSKQNQDGVLIAVEYGRFASIAVDPMEKKPLYHFYPGHPILSIGNNSCNLQCKFCQNWQISQQKVQTQYIAPEQLAALAAEKKSVGVAYTYAEPLMWFEYLLDACREVKARGLKNVMVTNGLINQEPLQELLPYIDALNIDIKSMRQEFYANECHGFLQPVLDTVTSAVRFGCHVEITNLVIPQKNDSEAEITELVQWIAQLRKDIPLHFSRYYPQYKYDITPTPVKTLVRCREIAQEYLDYVYIGNVQDVEANSTYCPSCKKLLIKRDGYRLSGMHIKQGRCEFCQQIVNCKGM